MHSPGRFMDENHEIERPDRDLSYFLPLYKATIAGDWGAIQRFLEEDPLALTAAITAFSETTLHVAVRKGLSLQVISRLVELMPPDSLETRDRNEETPLHSAGIVGNTEAARILYRKNQSLPQIPNIHGETPLHCAARFGHKETVNFLRKVTENDHPTYPYAGARGVALLNYLIAADFYDIALDLVLQFPCLAAEHDYDGSTALITLAQRPHAFESGNKVGFLQRLLCRGTVHMDLTEKAQAMLELAQRLCEEALRIKEAERILSPALLKAATLGIHQLVRLIINVYPDSIWFCDQDGRNIFHLAILFRRVEVFNLLYEMSLNKHHVLQLTDRLGNNILHLAGHLGPENTTLGPALQMQLDSQWFEEVEKLVQPPYKKMQNYNLRTPEETFAEEHKHLAKHGENWMTQVASSYAFVASLVTTVVFAGPFNVPGGTNNDGVPNFLHELSFMIFTVSDGLALFASSIAVLMFVSVVSSHDIRRYSPRMLSFGLVTLFISIASMLVAFGSSLYMVLVHRVSWVGIPIGLLSCVPATIVLILLYPIISKIVLATFGPSIFGHKKHETLEY